VFLSRTISDITAAQLFLPLSYHLGSCIIESVHSISSNSHGATILLLPTESTIIEESPVDKYSFLVCGEGRPVGKLEDTIGGYLLGDSA